MFESNRIRTTGIYTGKYRDLIKAARNEDLETMEGLVKEGHMNLDYADSINGVSLLNWCIFSKKVKSFEKLLKLGANPNWQDTAYSFPTPIIQAAKEGSTSRFLELSLKYRGNPNFLSKGIQGFENQTPLLGAVSYQRWDNVKILVENGADVNLTHDSMGTPLAEALVNDNIEMAKYLIDHGADYNNLKFWTQTVALDRNKQQILNSHGSPIMINVKELNILDFLRMYQFPLNSKKYEIKMEVVRFLQIRGLDYWKYPIPEDVKSEHKNDPEYLLKY